MRIQEHKVTVREVAEGYFNSAEEGVVGYCNNLDIRPKYQREFVYKDKQRDEVIRTVVKGLPLNVMYWVDRGEQYEDNPDEPRYEVLDGQQRTISLCESDAKRYFSKTGCAAGRLADNYMRGSSIRQEYLETAISWAAAAENKTIEGYMAEHQHDPTAQALWSYFRSVIEWVQSIFAEPRREMKGLPWGLFYNQHHKRVDLDPKILEDRVSELMSDEDVTRKAGVYEYLLTGDEKVLSIRAFDKRDARAAYERQKGICPICKKHFKIEEMHADHINPWSRGGHTTPDNCQMLCRDCNLKKGAQS